MNTDTKPRDKQHIEFRLERPVFGVKTFKGRYVAAKDAVYGRKDEVKLTNWRSVVEWWPLEASAHDQTDNT